MKPFFYICTMKYITNALLLFVTNILLSQVNDSPYFEYQWHEINIVESDEYSNLYINCFMEPWTQQNLQGEETWQFKIILNGDTVLNDTIFHDPDFLLLEGINENDIITICWTFRIWANWPYEHDLDPLTDEECYDIYYNGIDWVQSNGETLNVSEYVFNEVYNNKIYDILGREIYDISTLPYGTIYIKNGKKFIRTNEN